MSAVSACRRCGEPVTWAVTENGKPMPVDPYSCDDGNVRLLPEPTGTRQIAHVMSKAELADPPAGPRYKAHFATCGRS
jgi:hypothetical protein